MRLSMSVGLHCGGPAPAPPPPPAAPLWALPVPLCLQLCSQHSQGHGATDRGHLEYTSARQHRTQGGRSAVPYPVLPCGSSPNSLPCPTQGPPWFLGVVFVPTPSSQHASSHRGRTCRLSDRSSLSWHCGRRQRGCGIVVSGTGKCWWWGGGSPQPGFLSCTATTSQIKVSPGGASAAPGTLGKAECSTCGPGTQVAGWQPACARAGSSRCSLPSCSASAAHHQPLSL